jgi:DNA polymerase-3 subunit alpha
MIFQVSPRPRLSGSRQEFMGESESSEKNFAHLHLHSQYSLLESSITFENLINKCLEFNMPAVAVTDHGNMFGAVEFYIEAKNAGIKPILGCEVYIAPNGRLQKGINKDLKPIGKREVGEAQTGASRNPNLQSFPRLVLLAENITGYRNLCKLVSLGYIEGFYYKPRIDYEILKEYQEGIIALSGSLKGDVAQAFQNFGPEKALEKIEFYKNIFGDRFYLEVQRTHSQWEPYIEFLKEASKKSGLKLVATNEPHYMTKDEAFAQEVLLAIQAGKTLIEDSRPRLPSDQFYFKSAAQMRTLFKDLPEACDNTLEIAGRCDIEFSFTDSKGNTIYHLPTFPTPEGTTVTDYIKKLSLSGLETRFDEAKMRGEEILESDRPRYLARLEYELSVIDRMGFNGYFLIVQDFINHAKNNGIPVGPGRGSGAGSLVAYSLRVTDLDPLKYNLLFERFLNPERISMPDFDVDFCQDRRGEVINYVTEKYGAQCVAQIITFGKLQARAAIRDVGRAMGVPYSEVDAISKMVPDKLGITLQEAIDMEPRFKEASENDPKVGSLLNTALKLEGLTRHASIHAAGVIISDRPLVEHCPLYKGAEGETVVQFDMNHAEKIGLIKFDFLGLKTLTMIDNAIKLVHSNREGNKVAQALSTSVMSLSDPKIYELLSRGDTSGVFQFEGDGISDLIRKFKPSSFEDITAINALYRPGPMNMLDEYVARKHGKIKVTYLFPVLEEVLKETYGIIVYQEQVQLIAAKCANYSLGEADILRRAMGKKKPAEMAKQRERFLQGCLQNNLNPKKAAELFDLMAKFAEYGFNKSHAAAYCVVAAQTAFLKSYYPVEFYASLITTEMSDTDKIVQYIRDAREHHIKVRGPDVNSSAFKFSAVGEEIVFGLGGIKGVGQAAVEAIIEARQVQENKKFKSVLEFFENVDLRRVNKKVIECLIKAGAFDDLHSNRAQLYAGFEKFLEAAESTKRDREVGQSNFFDMTSETRSESAVELPTIEDWPRSRKLSLEKEVLGFYLSDHPLNGLESVLKNHVSCTIEGLATQASKKKVVLGGIVGQLKEFITKKGSRMAFGQLEDQTGTVELVIFPEAFQKYSLLLKESKPLIIKGQHEREDEGSKILVDELMTIGGIAARAHEVIVSLNASSHLPEDVTKVAEIFKRHRGEVKSRIDVMMPSLDRNISFELGPDFGISPTEDFFEDLERQMGSMGLATLN